MKAWSSSIFPVCHLDNWDVLESITSIVVNPLVIRTPPGQPRTKRIHFAGEKRRLQDKVCSICRQLGHNQVKYTNCVPLGGVFTSECESS